jgi:hypothetical protein
MRQPKPQTPSAHQQPAQSESGCPVFEGAKRLECVRFIAAFLQESPLRFTDTSRGRSKAAINRTHSKRWRDTLSPKAWPTRLEVPVSLC